MINDKCTYNVLSIQTLGLTTAVVTKSFLSSYIVHKLQLGLVSNIKMTTLVPISPTYYAKGLEETSLVMYLWWISSSKKQIPGQQKINFSGIVESIEIIMT